jgi:hypothetical protein
MPRWMLAALLALTGTWAGVAAACPNCKEAAAHSSETVGGIDAAYAGNPASAYNNSVLVMLAMPFVVVGGLALVAFRSCRRAARRAEASATKPARSACPPGLNPQAA